MEGEIYNGDFLQMKITKEPDLIITSPPYNLNIEYEEAFDWHDRKNIDNERKRVKTEMYAHKNS